MFLLRIFYALNSLTLSSNKTFCLCYKKSLHLYSIKKMKFKVSANNNQTNH